MTDPGSKATTIAWWCRRPARRGVAVFAALVWVVLVTLAVATDRAENSWPWLVALVLVVALWALARAATADLTDGRPERLDEREMAIRWRLSRIGYVCAQAAGLVGAFYLLAVNDDPDLLRRGAPLLLSLVVGVSCVPSFLWAWSAEDPDEE